ncbi:MAG: YdcF family protein [Rubrivivax sp.]|nr:YdcF family protein [Rubrivivax sp.]
MNEIFLTLGIESWKPLLSTLLLPPVPLLLLTLVGARLMFRRRLLAWLLVLLGVLGIYFSCTTALGTALQTGLLRPPPALSEVQVAKLRRAPKTAIVVLGGGRRPVAAEYGTSTLHARGLERLRYGIWLSRETSLPLAFSGGVGHGSEPGPTEADIAARIAEREFGRPLRWTESESRDTRENAFKTVALLQAQGIEQIVVVSHGYHLPRAMHHFSTAVQGKPIRLVAAPTGLPAAGRLRASDWVPTAQGFEENRVTWHEWLGRRLGA